MPNVPLPPNPTLVSKSGGVDALQTHRPIAGARPTSWRHTTGDLFKAQGWRLVNDAKDQDGAVVLFAEQNGPPLWVRIRSAEDGNGTLVDLAGARVPPKTDSAPECRAASGAKAYHLIA